jgi:hypothetical protein
MRTISDHIYDIAMNSVKAGAENINLTIENNSKKKEFKVTIKDDGIGISEDRIDSVFDPFYTTRDKKIRKVGLGLPLLKQNCEMTGGYVDLKSVYTKGTEITALFKTTSMNIPDTGDIAGTIAGLAVSSDEIDWHIKIKNDSAEEEISTYEIKEILGGVSIKNVEVIRVVNNIFKEFIGNTGL